MDHAFLLCLNLDILAQDAPNFSNVENLDRMFWGCSSLLGNSSMNLWDVSNVTSMRGTFGNTALFNQDIGNWNVFNVFSMNGMFAGALSFNTNINEWNVGNVNDLSVMFGGAESFNQPLNDWDVSNVVNFASVFTETIFNQPLNNWNTGNAKNMAGMFSNAILFNQDIGSWDVSLVENINTMFQGAESFNGDVSNWTTDNISEMIGAFEDAKSFNQDISGWNVSNVSDMRFMFLRANLSVDNYDSLLSGWSTQQLQSGVTFDAGNSQYCQGEAARQKLINDFGWVITDGGKSEDCSELQRPFILTVDTRIQGEFTNANQFAIVIRNQVLQNPFVYNYNVDWGDGNIEESINASRIHTYASPGIYQISITGDFP